MKSSSNRHINIITQSSRATFQACQKLYWFRYVLGLAPQKSDVLALLFGTLIHLCLDLWHASQFDESLCVDELGNKMSRQSAVYQLIDKNYPLKCSDSFQRQQWHYATAMLTAYMERYPEEKWASVETEKFVHGPIVNPKSGYESRTNRYAAKLDGHVVKAGDLGSRGNSHALLEHKTTSASAFGGSYIEKLWENPQIVSYVHYLEQQEQVQVNEVIYNVLVKPLLTQSEGETEEQYQVRYAKACAESKTGKSSAKRKIPESDDDFQARLIASYHEHPDRLCRQEIIVDCSQKAEILHELWQTTQQMNWCRTHDTWLRNRNNCHAFNRKCGYFECCSARPEELDQVIEMYMEPKKPHEEIQEYLGSIS